jgi:alkylated DNA repair dioxygenase AlkB
MDTLFPLNPVLPSGFVYVPDFLSPQEEDQLIQLITKIELHKFLFQGHEAKRKVASFGYDYSFDKRILTKGEQIPSTFYPIVEKVSVFLSIPENKFAELLITEYPVGSVINWHRDAPPFDLIVGLSFRSDCIFKLRPHDKEKRERKSIISIPVKRRSLYVMQGSARTEWQHSTAPVKDIRYSITLRTLRHSA